MPQVIVYCIGDRPGTPTADRQVTADVLTQLRTALRDSDGLIELPAAPDGRPAKLIPTRNVTSVAVSGES